ncbi:MAG: transcription-repair coupling factor, partial [Pirellulales bacterium]|nr:transcription-repair coupling factor [Pirellulales bacterium]
MAQAAQEMDARTRLLALPTRLAAQEGFAEIVAELRAGHAATLDGVWGSSCALVAAALAQQTSRPLVVVCPLVDDVDETIDDLRLFTELSAERFPAWESTLDERVLHDETLGDRVRMMKLLGGPTPPRLLVASIQSLMQPVPDAASLAAQTRAVRIGQPLARDPFIRWMVECGFHNTTAVELPGECAARGGIVDVFAPDWLNPVRVELVGDVVESIRSFSVT